MLIKNSMEFLCVDKINELNFCNKFGLFTFVDNEKNNLTN